ILASLRVDLRNLDRFQPGQINVLTTLGRAQAADLTATETHLDVDAGLLTVPELEAAGVQGDGAALRPVLAWSGELIIALVPEALQIGNQFVGVHRGALIEFDGAGVNACGQRPLQGVEIAAHGVVYPGAPAGNNQ